MIFVLFGSTAAILTGIFLDRTHKYLLALRLVSIISTISVAFAFILIPKGNFFGALLTVARAGTGIVPIMAVAYSLATECTHPV